MDEIDLYEFIGIMIGDGCLIDYPHANQYGIEISGNVIEEEDYYEKISTFLKREFDLNSKVFTRTYKDGSRALKISLYNKKFAMHLKQEYGFTRNKTYTVTIPPSLMKWDKAKGVLKGIFETDGCLYFSKSKVTTTKPTYPRLEITTVSTQLAEQIVFLLKSNGFSVQNHKNRRSTVIYLSGEKMLEKWVTEIGFNSNKNWSKYYLWKKLGYYIPRISLPERMKLLENYGEDLPNMKFIPKTI